MGLTEDEWAQAIEVLTATGHITDDKRQEFILWSDTLGLSMLVDALAHPCPTAPPSRPCSARSTCRARRCATTARASPEQAAGDPAWVHGRVLDLDGEPIAGAELDVWQNGDNRLYAVQDPEAPEDHLRGRFMTRDDGRFALRRRPARPVHDPRRRPGRPDAGRDRPRTRGGRPTST